MHIYITGVAGFLGSHLADFFLAKNYEVSGNDNLIGGYKDNVDKRVNFQNHDCEDFNKMNKVLKNVDVVIHAAAYAHEGLSVFSPHLICKNIVSGSTSVFSAAVNNKVKRIVFCSSMARYGDINPPFKESDQPNPVDPYGIAKLAAEKILINLCSTHNCEYNIAVPHNIIGSKQRYDDPFRNVASIMINLMLQDKQAIIYGDGEQKRSFSDINDCVYCIDKLALEPNIKSEIFNIGPDDNYITVNDLYKKISNQLQFNKDPIYYPDRQNEVKYANCSAQKSKDILGYKKSKDIDDSLKDIINYIKKRGVRKFEYDYELEIFNDKTPKTWKEKIF